jgi:hypothetical protein
MALTCLAIRVCERCNYEVNEGAVSCSHCGAPVTSNVAAFASATEDTGESFGPSLVEKEIQEGRHQRSKGDDEVAAALFRNALALEQIVPEGSDARRGERIRRFLQESGADGMRVQRQCRACGGSGKTLFTAEVIDGKATSVQSSVACRLCGGSGKVMVDATVAETMAARGAAAKRLAALQQSRKYVAVGGAWVPVSLETNLSVRQTALLKRTAAPPCQTCLGTCWQQCADCQGTGRQPCSNSKCVKGMVTEKISGGFKGMDLPRKMKCRTCGGTSYENCASCAGKGKAACAPCNGTGERAVCNRCDGAGTQSCAKCTGAGKVKGATCAACRGEGIMLCVACKGDGRKR